MSFKLVESKLNDENFISCKEFFNPIRSKKGITSPIKFDMCEFILCLLIGLKFNRKELLKEYELQKTAFAQKYIEDYINMKPLITGLMLSKIIKEAGVDRNEKDKVKEIMKNVLDSNEPTFLKKETLDIMHQYYLGGYCILLKEFDNKAPVDVSVFFSKYNELLKN